MLLYIYFLNLSSGFSFLISVNYYHNYFFNYSLKERATSPNAPPPHNSLPVSSPISNPVNAGSPTAPVQFRPSNAQVCVRYLNDYYLFNFDCKFLLPFGVQRK